MDYARLIKSFAESEGFRFMDNYSEYGVFGGSCVGIELNSISDAPQHVLANLILYAFHMKRWDAGPEDTYESIVATLGESYVESLKVPYVMYWPRIRGKVFEGEQKAIEL